MSAAAGRAPSSVAGEKTQTGQELQHAESRWQPVLRLPCQLTVDLPLATFRVADFVKLRVGTILATNWQVARDVPLRVNGILIGWGEFEEAGSRLAVRLTELA